MRRNPLAIAVILTAVSGCDNVTWDGVDVQLRSPPARAELVAEAPGLAAAIAEEVEVPPVLPEGPVLLAGARSGSEATLYVVGEVQGDAVLDLTSESEDPRFRDYFQEHVMGPGSEWILFSEGVRVGRMVAREPGVDDRFCEPRATVTGTVELVPSAASAARLMALPADAVAEREYERFSTHSHDYDQRVGSLALATSTIPQVGAPWPPDGVLSIRQDIQALQFADADTESIAASFVFRDRIGVGAPGASAYSLFVMGEPAANGFRRTFSWYRSAEADGKGVARYFGHLDLDGDGSEEVLLDVFGEESRWFAGLSVRNGSLVRTFEDACGTADAP